MKTFGLIFSLLLILDSKPETNEILLIFKYK